MKYNHIILDTNVVRTIDGEGTKVMVANDIKAKGLGVVVIPTGYEFITLPMVAILGSLASA